ncbi:MAG: zinc-binding dehydrogenase [Bacteroidota bacterium]
MKSSETAVFHSHETPFELKQLPIPALKPGEILVRNEYTTLCRSDLYTYCGIRFEPSPTILGHEIVGRIAEFGPEADTEDLRGKTLSIGDRISWAIFAADPNSDMAQRGIPQKGPDLFKYGHERLTEDSVLHGGLSQYTILKPHTPLIAIDEAVPLKVAAIVNCAVATIAGSMRLAGDVAGKNVLVCGAGMLGIIACAMSKTQGAAHVAALDLKQTRLETATKFGADICLLAESDYRQEAAAILGKAKPFDVIIEVCGVPEIIEQSLELLGIGGVAVWAGATFPQRNVQVNAEKIVRSLLTIKGLHNYNRADFATAVQFMETQHRNFPFADIIHEQFGLEQVNEAFAYAVEANPFRVGVRID